MIAIDTNILIYAHRADAPFHAVARRCVRALAEGRAAWAIPWPCVHEFLAVVTRRRVFDPPTPVETALVQIDAWLESPSLVLLGDGPGYWVEVRALVAAAHVVGPQVHDARVAALCRLHGVRELWTADRDFSRFDLPTRNPLLADRAREGTPRYGRRRVRVRG